MVMYVLIWQQTATRIKIQRKLFLKAKNHFPRTLCLLLCTCLHILFYIFCWLFLNVLLRYNRIHETPNYYYYPLNTLYCHKSFIHSHYLDKLLSIIQEITYHYISIKTSYNMSTILPSTPTHPCLFLSQSLVFSSTSLPLQIKVTLHSIYLHLPTTTTLEWTCTHTQSTSYVLLSHATPVPWVSWANSPPATEPTNPPNGN